MQNPALRFVLLLGIISLFTDMAYEATRSISGPYLGLLGASGAVVGIVAGCGELVGFALRFFSGWWADHSRKYWLVVFIGYCMNLLVIPALAFVGHWQWAALLIILERMGKAIRTPARDAMLSYATQKLGAGWGFGIHQALDQVGGFLGPLLVAGILFFHGSYQACFLTLIIPALISLSILYYAKTQYPVPSHLEVSYPHLETQKVSPFFWVYLIASALIAAGYVDYPLIAYRFSQQHILSSDLIPVFYAIAMGISAISALVLGRYYDRFGMNVLILATIVSLPFAPFAFYGGFTNALISMILWGIGMGSQRSLIKAVIVHMVPKNKRGYAYGLFNAGYGVAWFLGSAAMGILYDHTIFGLVLFSLITQFLAIPLLIWIKKRHNQPLHF